MESTTPCKDGLSVEGVSMSTILGKMPFGSIVRIRESGQFVNYLVAHHGNPSPAYEGLEDGTLLLRERLLPSRQMTNNNSPGEYLSAEINRWLNNEFVNSLDVNIRNHLLNVRIPYRPGTLVSDTTVYEGRMGLQTRAFLPSLAELGLGNDAFNWPDTPDNEGVRLDIFKEAGNVDGDNPHLVGLQVNGTPAVWGVRTPRTMVNNLFWGINNQGRKVTLTRSGTGNSQVTNTHPRPLIAFNSYNEVSEDGELVITQPPPSMVLGRVPMGTIVRFPVGGRHIEFVVVHHRLRNTDGYRGGENGVVLLAHRVLEEMAFNTVASNDYENSDVREYLEGEFYDSIDRQIREGCLLEIRIPFRPGETGSVVARDNNGLSSNIFLLSTLESNVATSNVVAGIGAIFPLFPNASRPALALNFTPRDWWTRVPASANINMTVVHANGAFTFSAPTTVLGVRPALVLHDGAFVSVDSTIVVFDAPDAPQEITVTEPLASDVGATISWSEVTGRDGQEIEYLLEHSTNGGAWRQLFFGTRNSFSYTLSSRTRTVQYRVKARISLGLFSPYTTTDVIDVINVRLMSPPKLSGEDEFLGMLSEPPIFRFTAEDGEEILTIKERLNGVLIREYTVKSGEEFESSISIERFRTLANADEVNPHSFTITALNRFGLSATRTVTFGRQTEKVEVSMSSPISSIIRPTRILLNVVREVPAGATLRVFACNNGFDGEPTWEDCTQNVISGEAYIFENTSKTAIGWGVNVRAILTRGTARGLCYIANVGGNFV